MVGEPIFLDTNVLLAALVPSRPSHAAAIRVLDGALGQGHVNGQVLREMLVVSTRPVEVNGLGQDLAIALRNVGLILRRVRFLAEGREVPTRLRALIDESACLGKQIHDANVVATMLVHGVPTLVTGNPKHFARFDGQIAVRDLAEA